VSTAAASQTNGCSIDAAVLALDFFEDVFEGFAGETARFVDFVDCFPTLESSPVDAPFFCRLTLGEAFEGTRGPEPFSDGLFAGSWHESFFLATGFGVMSIML
jgi:hypothetical protein